MLDPKIIAYLREHPDVLSHVIEKLLEEPNAHFSGRSKRGAFLNNQYDNLGRPVKPDVPPPDGPDFLNDVLVRDVRGVIENLVIDAVRDDESAFIDLFLLAMVCKSLRADLLIRVKKLETRFDVVPHYCRAAFVHYDDLDTFKLFIERLDSCAPAVATAWKYLLSNEDREAKFAKLHRRMQRKRPDHFALALLNDARDPIAATVCLHFMARDKSPFTKEEIEALFDFIPDKDLVLSMQPRFHRIEPLPLTMGLLTEKVGHIWADTIHDHARYWHYCAKRYELGMKYQDEGLMDIRIHINMGVDKVDVKSLLKVQENDERSPMLEAAFKVFHQVFPGSVSHIIGRVARRFPDQREHIRWAMVQMVSCGFDMAAPAGIVYDANSQTFITDFNVYEHLDVPVRRSAMERIMRPDVDFELVKKVLNAEPVNYLRDYYVQAARQQNVAVLEYIKLNPRVDPRTWLLSGFDVILKNAGVDGGVTQLRLFEAILPSGMSDLELFAFLKRTGNISFYIAGPLAFRIQEVFARLQVDVPVYLRRGIDAIKIQNSKSVSEALMFLGLNPIRPEASNRQRTLEALQLVLTYSVSREVSRAVIYIVSQGDFTEMEVRPGIWQSPYETLRNSFLFSRHELNPNALWECIRATPRFADEFYRAMDNLLPQLSGKCYCPLVFIEQWINSFPGSSSKIAAQINRFNAPSNNQPAFVTNNAVARFMRLPVTFNQVREVADTMKEYEPIRKQLDSIKKEEDEDSDTD